MVQGGGNGAAVYLGLRCRQETITSNTGLQPAMVVTMLDVKVFCVCTVQHGKRCTCACCTEMPGKIPQQFKQHSRLCSCSTITIVGLKCRMELAGRFGQEGNALNREQGMCCMRAARKRMSVRSLNVQKLCRRVMQPLVLHVHHLAWCVSQPCGRLRSQGVQMAGGEAGAREKGGTLKKLQQP